MKTTLLILTMAFAVGWYSNGIVDAAPADAITEDELDALLANDPPEPTVEQWQPPRRGNRDRPGPAMRRGGKQRHAGFPGRGRPNAGMTGPGAGGPGRGIDRAGDGLGGQNAAMGRHGLGGPVMLDSAEIIAFLQEHEPDMAKKLAKLLQNDPQQFQYWLASARGLYAPVIRIMDRDPQMGQLQLEKVRLQLRAKRALAKVNKAEKDSRAKPAKKLHKIVGKLFDIIMEQGELRLRRAYDQIDQWQQPDENRQPTDRRRGLRKAPARRHRRVAERLGWLQERLSDKQELLESWRLRKEQIVRDRVMEMLQSREPFPWGR